MMPTGIGGMQPDELTSMLSDPHTPPGLRAAAVAAMQMRQPQGPQGAQPQAAPGPQQPPMLPPLNPGSDVMAPLRAGTALADSMHMAMGGPVRAMQRFAGGGPVRMAMGGDPADAPDASDDTDADPTGGGLGNMDPKFIAMIQKMMSAGAAPSSEDKGLALAQAGFGMAASGSPHFGQAIGEGATYGIQALQKLRQERAVQAMRAATLGSAMQQKSDALALRKDIATQASADRQDAIEQRAAAAKDRASNMALSLADREQANQQLNQYRQDLLELRRGQGGANLPDGTGDAFLSQLPETDQAVVKKVADGTVDPRSLSPRDGYRNRIIAATSQYDPDYDQTNISARVKTRNAWAPGGTVATSNNALDTVVGHIGKLSTDIDKLNNFGGYATILNAPANWLNKKSGQTAITNFNTDADAVATEIAKAYKGGGALAEGQIKEWRSNLDPSMSPEQLKGSVDHVLGLLDSKAEANVKQWNEVMGSKNQRDVPFIYGDKSRATLAKINPDRYGSFVATSPGASVPTPGATPAAEPPRLTDDAAGHAAYSALPSGAKFIDDKGQIRTKP